MALDTTTIQEKISAKFGDKVSFFDAEADIFTFEAEKESLHSLIAFLRDELGFNFLTDVCGVHFPDNEKTRQFATVYHLHNWLENVRVRIKTFLDGEKPEVDSVSDLFLSANWQERETYDFYGIVFNNHPDLKRILNMDEMESFPLRKEFPLEDNERTDKDDRYFGRMPNNSMSVSKN